MSETKKPSNDDAKATATEEELSEEQLEQVAGGAAVPTNPDQVKPEASPFYKITINEVFISKI